MKIESKFSIRKDIPKKLERERRSVDQVDEWARYGASSLYVGNSNGASQRSMAYTK